MDSENTATSEVPVKKRGRKPGKRGRPKGSLPKAGKKRGRKRRRGRPKSSLQTQKSVIPVKRRGRRPQSVANTNQQLSNGIHLIGELLVVDVNVLGCNEVVFVGKTPKIR